MSDNYEVGQRVTIVESSTPGKVIRMDTYNVVVEDEQGRIHAFRHGSNRIVPQTFLSESN